MAANSKEYTILKRNRTTLIKHIQHGLKDIADPLYGDGVLTRNQHTRIIENENRASGARDLLGIMLVTVETDPSAFPVFIDLFRREGNKALGIVARNMEKECESLPSKIKKKGGGKKHQLKRPLPDDGQSEKRLLAIFGLICFAIGLYCYCCPPSVPDHPSKLSPVASNCTNEDNISKELQTVEQQVQQNLPYIESPLFGREHDLKKLEHLLVSRSAQIININGPPAFGKSTLAIKLGERLLESKSTTTVRYIDTESTRQSWYLCTHSTAPNDLPSYNIDRKGHAVQNTTGSSDPSYSHLYEPNLCEWSEKLNSWSVLILDNCDQILNGELRNKFIGVISSHLRQGRSMNLSIILTSQERLEFLDHAFRSWSLKELTLENSIELLQHYVPDLSVKYAQNLSTVVGHCPLALKVIGKLLVNRDTQNFGALLYELENRVIRTISDKLTDNETRFRTIMDVAYNNLDPRIQVCSKIISFFPGSFDLRMGESIVGKFMDPDCIQTVLRKSFSDQLPSGNQVRYTMHKLIRDYFAEKRKKEFTSSFYRDKFNWHFMEDYSDFLKELMVSTYHRNITEEEHYKLFYLEAHNIHYFAQRVLLLTELSENISLSLGFIIHENLLQTNCSSTLHQNILRMAYNVFTSNQTIFNKLCVSCTHKVCASIYWKTVVSVSVPECTKDLDNSNFYPYWATSFFETKPCSYIFSCSNLTSIQNVMSLVSSEVTRLSSSEKDIKLLFYMIDFAVIRCDFTGTFTSTVNYIGSKIPPIHIGFFSIIMTVWFIVVLYKDIRGFISEPFPRQVMITKLIRAVYVVITLILVLKNRVGLASFDLIIGVQVPIIVIFILVTTILQYILSYYLYHHAKFSRVLFILYIFFLLVIPIIIIMLGPEEYCSPLVLHVVLVYGLIRIYAIVVFKIESFDLLFSEIVSFLRESCVCAINMIIMYLILSFIASRLADYEIETSIEATSSFDN